MNGSSDSTTYQPVLPPVGTGSFSWDAALGARVGRQRPASSRRDTPPQQIRPTAIAPDLDPALTAAFL